MTIPLNDLLVTLKWGEEGAQIPEHARAQLAALAAQQAALARQGGLGASPGAAPGAPLRPGAGRNPFQADWASNAEIMQAFARDAAKARRATDELRDGLENVQPAAAGTGRAVSALRTAVGAAAFQIVGMGGAIGRVASGLLLFAGGSGAALAAVVAIGSLGLAFRAATADARMNREENEKVVASLRELGAHGIITSNRIRIAQLEQERDAPTLAQRFRRAPLLVGPRIGGGWRPEEREQIERELARLRGESGGAGEDLTRPGREALRSATFAFEAAKLRQQITGGTFETGRPVTARDVTERTRALELRQDPHITAAQATAIAARERETAAVNALTEAQLKAREALEDAAIRLQMVGQPQAAVTEALRVRALERAGEAPATAEDLARREREAARRTDRASLERTLRSPEFALSTLTTLTQGIRQGGTGALGALGSLSMGLSGMTGIAGTAAAGPLGWAGFGLQAVSSVFGLFDNKEERRHKELVDTIKRLGKEVGLERVTVVFTGPDGHQQRKTLAELEESDAVERVPGPVGAGG